MAREGLGPKAEGTLGGTPAGRKKAYKGVEKERDVIPGDVQVAMIDFCGPGQRIKFLMGEFRTVGVVLNDAI